MHSGVYCQVIIMEYKHQTYLIAVGSQDHTACNNMNQCHELSSIQFDFSLDIQSLSTQGPSTQPCIFTLNTVFSHCTPNPGTIDVKLYLLQSPIVLA